MFKAIQMRWHGLSFDVSMQPTDKCWATVWCKSRWIPLASTDFLPIYSDVTESMIFPFRFTLDLFPVFHNSVSSHCVQKQPGPDLDLICIGWKQLFQMKLHWIYNGINKRRIWSIPREKFPGRCCVRTFLLWWSGALPLISMEKFHLNPGLKPWAWAALHIQGLEAPLSSRRLANKPTPPWPDTQTPWMALGKHQDGRSSALPGRNPPPKIDWPRYISFVTHIVYNQSAPCWLCFLLSFLPWGPSDSPCSIVIGNLGAVQLFPGR